MSESVLKTMIGKLRAALGDDAGRPRYIETVPRRGYRFIATSPLEENIASTQPQPAAMLKVLSAERAVHQIRELLQRCTGGTPLVLLLQHPMGERAAASLMEHIARWSLVTGND